MHKGGPGQVGKATITLYDPAALEPDTVVASNTSFACADSRGAGAGSEVLEKRLQACSATAAQPLAPLQRSASLLPAPLPLRPCRSGIVTPAVFQDALQGYTADQFADLADVGGLCECRRVAGRAARGPGRAHRKSALAASRSTPPCKTPAATLTAPQTLWCIRGTSPAARCGASS